MFRSKKWTAIGIFLLAFSVRCTQLGLMDRGDRVAAIVLSDGTLLSYDEGVNVAKSLVVTGEYADPFFNHQTGPTAHLPPSFPAATALLFYVFGTGYDGAIARDVVNMAGYSLLFALLPAASAWFGMARIVGIVAGFAAASYPFFRLSELNTARDEWLAAILLLLLTVYAWRIAGRDELTNRSALLYGAGWGALMYAQPVTVPILAVHLAIVLFTRQRATGRRLAYAALVSAAFVTVIAPWVVRNRLVMGGWIFMRDNAGLELAVSNGDGAKASFEGNMHGTWFCTVHPNCNPAAVEQIRQSGELEFNRIAMQNALSWIRENPSHFAQLTFRRVVYFWCDFPSHGSLFFIRAVTSLLGLAGLWMMWRRGLALQAILFGVIWIVYPLTFYVVQYMDRYVVPMAPEILLPAAFAICALAAPKTKLVEAGGVGLEPGIEPV